MKIIRSLKDVVSFLQYNHLINSEVSKPELVIELRRFMHVVNLKVIPDITYNGAYRAQLKNNINVDTYVLYAWKQICETYAQNIRLDKDLDTEVLSKKIPEIKSLMFLKLSEIRDRLTQLLAECGIAFVIVPHFKGAPVQGFIDVMDSGKVMLCLTLRQKRADKFWFTLFHELGHILNGDAETRFVDFDSVKSEQEEEADIFASNVLLEPEACKDFIRKEDYSLSSINRFAKQQKVMNYVVIGRLQALGELDWSAYPNEFIYYEWA